MKILISLGAVAAVALTSAPAVAQHHSSGHNEWNDNHHRGHHARQAHKAKWNKGYRFGRNYRYTSYNALPRTYVRQYNLSPRYRYVYTDGYIYQVDPTSYAITRIISALTGY